MGLIPGQGSKILQATRVAKQTSKQKKWSLGGIELQGTKTRKVKLMKEKGYFRKNLFMQIDTLFSLLGWEGWVRGWKCFFMPSAQNSLNINVAYLEVSYSDPFQTFILQNKTTSYLTSIMGLFRNRRGIAIRDKKFIAKTIGKLN